jgi:methyl-accepting chemotaxis protein
MNFEDTNLPDCRAAHIAFEKAKYQAAAVNRGKPQPWEDTGMGAGSLKLFVRAGEILTETVPSADPEQIASAVLFLNVGFQEPDLMQRAHGRALPRVCAWAQEWHNINSGEASLKKASLKLRQIVTAVNIALMEGLKNNLPDLNVNKMLKDLAEKDLMAEETGNLRAPALRKKFRQMRDELGQLLDAMQPNKSSSPRPSL